MKETTLLDFALLFMRKLVANTRKMDDMKFENTIVFTGDELVLSDFMKILQEKEMRGKRIELGRDLGDKYLIKKLKNSVDDLS